MCASTSAELFTFTKNLMANKEHKKEGGLKETPFGATKLNCLTFKFLVKTKKNPSNEPSKIHLNFLGA